MYLVLRWGSFILLALGLAFSIGAYLAFVQGVVSQIGVLAVTGIICLILGIVMQIVRMVSFH